MNSLSRRFITERNFPKVIEGNMFDNAELKN